MRTPAVGEGSMAVPSDTPGSSERLVRRRSTAGWIEDRFIQDTLTALRTGEAVGIDDYGEGDVRPQWGAEQPLAVETQESCPT